MHVHTHTSITYTHIHIHTHIHRYSKHTSGQNLLNTVGVTHGGAYACTLTYIHTYIHTYIQQTHLGSKSSTYVPSESHTVAHMHVHNASLVTQVQQARTSVTRAPPVDIVETKGSLV